MASSATRRRATLTAFLLILGVQGPLAAEPEDRGITTSLLGTYIQPREWLVYPFFEYTRHDKFEYTPSQFGVRGPGADDEFRGKTVEREYLLFVAYAFNDSFAVEFESALHASIDFTRAGDDLTGTPDKLKESGLGDTEINLRYRYAKETATRSDITFFFKTVFPLQKNKTLLGSRDWEFEPGFVLTKNYSFGTLAVRGSLSWTSGGERKLDFAEWGIDYVKRLSPNWRLALSLEGEQADEISVIGELQYTLARNMVLKLNTGIGLTEKAARVAPEIGLLLRF